MVPLRPLFISLYILSIPVVLLLGPVPWLRTQSVKLIIFIFRTASALLKTLMALGVILFFDGLVENFRASANMGGEATHVGKLQSLLSAAIVFLLLVQERLVTLERAV